MCLSTGFSHCFASTGSPATAASNDGEVFTFPESLASPREVAGYLDETGIPVGKGGNRVMFIVQSGTSAYTKRYSARYIAVGGPVSAGTFASAQAKFTLTWN